MSDSVRPYRWQPTRLPCPWDSPGKNTGVGCHFFLQCMKVKSESEVAQLCLTPRDPMDHSLPGSSVHGIFQARVLEWVAIAFSGEAFGLCQNVFDLWSCPKPSGMNQIHSWTFWTGPNFKGLWHGANVLWIKCLIDIWTRPSVLQVLYSTLRTITCVF